MVRKLTYKSMPICVDEVLRYSGSKEANDNIDGLINEIIDETKNILTFKVCYDEFSVKICDNVCDFGAFKIESKALSRNLNGCDRAIIFGATIGTPIDRLIAKYGRLSPTKALLLQAFGAQQIESLCDKFCKDIAMDYGKAFKPRFSPGYGDVPLDTQVDIFKVLDLSKQIGLCLNDSLLMSPSKSVTAIAGITEDEYVEKEKQNKCKACYKTDCAFRSK